MYNLDVPAAKLSGTITAKVMDPHGVGTERTVIHTHDPFEVKVDWMLDDEFASLVGGTWHLVLSIMDTDGVGTTTGKLAEFHVGLDSVPPMPVPRRYTHTFTFNPFRVEPGVYNITAVLTYTNGTADPLPISGFAETGHVEFYKAKLAAPAPHH